MPLATQILAFPLPPGQRIVLRGVLRSIRMKSVMVVLQIFWSDENVHMIPAELWDIMGRFCVQCCPIAGVKVVAHE
jgi:hypothetical protein